MKILTNPAEAAQCLLCGGIAIYPTETFFALGCLGDNENAAQEIYRIKERPTGKFLPLVAASMEQAQAAVNLAGAPTTLLERFWPGPLAILLPAKDLAPASVNARGKAAIRVDANPLAQELAHLAGGALTASSANLSGLPAPCRIDSLDPNLLCRLERLGDRAVILAPAGPETRPKGGLPSTIVEFLPQKGNNALKIIRAGATSREALCDAGFFVIR